MKRFGTPTLYLHVYGDWLTVIGAREYRDVLIDQKPDDEDQAEYGCYRIQCKTEKEMVAGYNEFRNRLNLRCLFVMEFLSDDKSVRMFCASGDGYSNQSPHCQVEVIASDSAIENAAKEAIDILKKAIK